MNILSWFALYLIANIVVVGIIDFNSSTHIVRYGKEKEMNTVQYYIHIAIKAKKDASLLKHFALMIFFGIPIMLIVWAHELLEKIL